MAKLLTHKNLLECLGAKDPNTTKYSFDNPWRPGIYSMRDRNKPTYSTKARDKIIATLIETGNYVKAVFVKNDGVVAGVTGVNEDYGIYFELININSDDDYKLLIFPNEGFQRLRKEERAKVLRKSVGKRLLRELSRASVGLPVVLSSPLEDDLSIAEKLDKTLKGGAKGRGKYRFAIGDVAPVVSEMLPVPEEVLLAKKKMEASGELSEITFTDISPIELAEKTIKIIYQFRTVFTSEGDPCISVVAWMNKDKD